jgi:hypothetical protein
MERFLIAHATQEFRAMTGHNPIPALCLALLGAMSGCQLVGVVAENYRRTQTRTVNAESLALEAKTFAVVVSADRGIHAQFPLLAESLAAKITERLANPANTPRAAGYVPTPDVVRYISDNPTWALKEKSELARALGGVDRLLIVELLEYRLHAPGNPYIWDGVGSASVAVYDPTSPNPEMPVFERTITVRFPDQQGRGPEEMPPTLVNSALMLRIVDRVSWLFYTHEEPYDPTY